MTPFKELHAVLFCAFCCLQIFLLSFLYYWHDQILIITPGSAIFEFWRKKQKQNKKKQEKSFDFWNTFSQKKKSQEYQVSYRFDSGQVLILVQTVANFVANSSNFCWHFHITGLDKWHFYSKQKNWQICFLIQCVCLLMPCGHLLGKGGPLGSRLWCLIVKLSLFHWYPGSGVVLDCFDSWSFPSFLLSCCLLPWTNLAWSAADVKSRLHFQDHKIVVGW